MLHSSLSFSFGGTFCKWKQNLAKYIDARLRVYNWSPEAPGHEANAHREHVLRHYCHTEQLNDLRTGAKRTQRLKFLHTILRLLNGDYRRRGIIEHWCKGWPGCCKDANHTKEQLKRFFVWFLKVDLQI